MEHVSAPTIWAVVVFAALGGIATGCNVERERGVDVDSLRGWILADPLAKVDFTLTSTTGQPFDFRVGTEGYVTLLFFGYTYCPDVCPVQMANIGAVLHKLPPDVANQLRVVFVTTDPERDTPERLRAWLDNFDRDIIGLTGPLDEVNAVQGRLGLGKARPEEWPDGGYGVAHSAQVIAFTTDNMAHVMYPFGTRQEDWAHDLPRLVIDGPPGSR